MSESELVDVTGRLRSPAATRSARSKATDDSIASYEEAAARSGPEWRLISASHNLLKLHSHWIAPATG